MTKNSRESYCSCLFAFWSVPIQYFQKKNDLNQWKIDISIKSWFAVFFDGSTELESYRLLKLERKSQMNGEQCDTFSYCYLFLTTKYKRSNRYQRHCVVLASLCLSEKETATVFWFWDSYFIIFDLLFKSTIFLTIHRMEK